MSTLDSAASPAASAILVHGFLDAGSLWQPVSDALASSGLRCRTPDLPGMGLRSNETAPAITLSGMADEIAHLIELSETPVVLVGHSMGAQVAELAAKLQPTRVAALVLLTPVPLGGLPVPEEIATAMRNLGGNAQGQQVLRKQFGGVHIDAVLGELLDVGMKVEPAVVTASFSAWSTGTVEGNHPSAYNGPTLIIGGARDSFATPDLIDGHVAPRFAHATLRSIAGAGHWPHVEQPKDVVAVLKEFLAEKGLFGHR